MIEFMYLNERVDSLLNTGIKFEDIVYAVRKVVKEKYKEELKKLENDKNEW